MRTLFASTSASPSLFDSRSTRISQGSCFHVFLSSVSDPVETRVLALLLIYDFSHPRGAHRGAPISIWRRKLCFSTCTFFQLCRVRAPWPVASAHPAPPAPSPALILTHKPLKDTLTPSLTPESPSDRSGNPSNRSPQPGVASAHPRVSRSRTQRTPVRFLRSLHLSSLRSTHLPFHIAE